MTVSSRRAALAATAVAAAAIALVPAGSASAAAPTLSVSPASQSISSGGTARWTVSASGGTVRISFGDGTSASHAAGRFTVAHSYRICEARQQTRRQVFSVTSSGQTKSVATTVTINYTGPICS